MAFLYQKNILNLNGKSVMYFQSRERREWKSDAINNDSPEKMREKYCQYQWEYDTIQYVVTFLRTG